MMNRALACISRTHFRLTLFVPPSAFEEKAFILTLAHLHWDTYLHLHTCTGILTLAHLHLDAFTLTLGYLHLHTFTYKLSLGHFCAIVSIEV